MADGSHFGFIQKPVTFEPFEITTTNLVSRLSTYLEFSRTLKFLVFQNSEMADGSHLGFIQKPVTFEPLRDNRAKFGIQTQYNPRIRPDYRNFQFFQKYKMADGSHLGFIQKPVTFEPFEITSPNLVSRLSTSPGIQPDFEICSFSEIQDGGLQPFWIYSKAGNF